MSSEVRVVRPYDGVDRFQGVLDGWRLRVGPDEVEIGQVATVPSSNYMGIKPVLVASADDDGAEALRKEAATAAENLGLAPDDVELLVLVSTPFLRLANVVHRKPLSASDVLAPSMVLGADRPVTALQAPTAGCDVEVYFVLARHLDQRPLVPSRKGTWLGKARFSLRTELGELGFTPIPLTKDQRKRLELGDSTIRFVQVEPEQLRSESLADVVQLYLDEKILANLNQAPGSSAAKAFQRQLYLDVMSAVVRAAQRMSDFPALQLSELDGTFLGRVVESAAGRVKGESGPQFRTRCELALHWLKADPERFMAAIEAGAAPGEDWRAAIGGEL